VLRQAAQPGKIGKRTGTAADGEEQPRIRRARLIEFAVGAVRFDPLSDRSESFVI
jgi:hypothetical protein